MGLGLVELDLVLEVEVQVFGFFLFFEGDNSCRRVFPLFGKRLGLQSLLGAELDSFGSAQELERGLMRTLLDHGATSIGEFVTGVHE